MSDLSPSEITHQIKYEQNDEHKAEPSATTDMPPVSISAAAEDKDKENNNDN